jgi:phenylacetate-CoA ligase
MLIIRGVNVYPSSIEAVLGRFEEITPHYLIRLTRTGHLDEATVEVEMSELFFRGSAATQDAGESADMDVLGARVAARVKDALGIKINVELRPPNAVPRSQGGKIQRVQDLRST